MIYYAVEEPIQQNEFLGSYGFSTIQDEKIDINRYVFLWKDGWKHSAAALSKIVDYICSYTESPSHWVLAWKLDTEVLPPAQYRFREYYYRNNKWKFHPLGNLMILIHPREYGQNIFLPPGHLISEPECLIVISREPEEWVKRKGLITTPNRGTSRILPTPLFVRSVEGTKCVLIYSQQDTLGRKGLVILSSIPLCTTTFAEGLGVDTHRIEPPDSIWLIGP